MSELPNKIISFDILKVEHGRRKLCQCAEPHYTLDYQNKLVICDDCGAIIDPIEALRYLASHWGRIEDRLRSMHEQAKEIQNYKPHLKVFKKLESDYRRDHFSMLPLCPHCSEPFDFNELFRWVNRGLYPQYKREK